MSSQTDPVAPSPPPEPDAYFKLALDHTWNYFTVHASQRMQLVNFWLVAMAFLAGALVTAITKSRPGLAVAIAAAGALTTLAFHRLDRRTRQLVKLAEEALTSFESTLAAASGVDVNILTKSDQATRSLPSTYSEVILAIHTIAFLAFIAAGLYVALD